MAPSASSDADLILSLRAGDAPARNALVSRYRPLARRLALACGIGVAEVDATVERMLTAALAAVVAPGPAPVDFGAAVSVALRDEVATHARRTQDPNRRAGSPPAVAAESVMRDAGLASAELVASWRMLLWAVHVERVDVDRAAQVADVRPDEALAVLRRAEEALASGVIARALQRSDHSHEPFLGLLELRSAGTLDPADRDLLDAHLRECESCSATGRWLIAFRSDPGVTLAAATLGVAAHDYLLSAGAGPRGTATAPALVSRAAPGKSRGLLVTASAVIAALGLLVVAVLAPGTSTLSAQMLRQPTPTTAGERPTGGAPEPITHDTPTTARSSAVSPSSVSPSSVVRPTRPTPPAPTSEISTTDSAPTGGAVSDPEGGSPDPTSGTEGVPATTVDDTWVTVAGTSTPVSSTGAAPTAATTPRPTDSRPAVSVTTPSVPAPPATAPVTTPPTSTGPTASRPPTSVPGTTPPSSSAPSSPPSSSGPPPPPSLDGVRLTDDWSTFTITVGLGFSRSTTLRNDSERTSAPVLVRIRTPLSVLMSLTADGRTCGPIGLLTREILCTVSPLAPGATVRLRFSATLPLAVGSQTATTTLSEA